jgi:hypothetical protein
MKCINCFLKMSLNIEICLLLLTKKCAIFDVNTFLLRIAILHVSMSKHLHQRVFGYAKVTISIEASSTVVTIRLKIKISHSYTASSYNS